MQKSLYFQFLGVYPKTYTLRFDILTRSLYIEYNSSAVTNFQTVVSSTSFRQSLQKQLFLCPSILQCQRKVQKSGGDQPLKTLIALSIWSSSTILNLENLGRPCPSVPPALSKDHALSPSESPICVFYIFVKFLISEL